MHIKTFERLEAAWTSFCVLAMGISVIRWCQDPGPIFIVWIVLCLVKRYCVERGPPL